MGIMIFKKTVPHPSRPELERLIVQILYRRIRKNSAKRLPHPPPGRSTTKEGCHEACDCAADLAFEFQGSRAKACAALPGRRLGIHNTA